MTRPLRVGDRVTATGTVAAPIGGAYGPDAGWVITWDKEGLVWQGPVPTEALTLIAPAEPPVGSVVVKDGKAYTRFETRSAKAWGAFGVITDGGKTWDEVSDGDVIFTPGGDANVG